jgi:prepilin-type N-terminal cleavage/methylation domain-containing protein
MKPGERGFTLLEVLVATAIMGIVVAGVMSGLTTASRNAARLTQYDRATILARATMDELLSTKLRRGVALEGRYAPEAVGGAEAGWRAMAAPFETLDASGTGYWVFERVSLEVWWMDGATRRSFSLDGYRRGTQQAGGP